jgi:hypothetical protein
MNVGDLVRSFNEDAWHFGMHGIAVALGHPYNLPGRGMVKICWGEQGTFWERIEVIEVVNASR